MKFVFPNILKIQTHLFSLPSLGLDISDASYHFAKASYTTSGPRVEYAGEGTIPPGLIEFGEIKKEKELISVLSEIMVREKKVRRDHFLIASLPEEKAFIKKIKIGATSGRKEMENAILFEAEGAIPLSSREMYFDYEDITAKDTTSDHRDIIIVAFPKNIVDAYVRVFHGAGFIPAVLELESQAVIRALVDYPKQSGPFLVIDIGRTKSGFTFFSHGSIFFTSTLPIGGRDFEHAISEALIVPSNEAEKIKKETGFSKTAYDGKLAKALEPFISMIASETVKNVEFFETRAFEASEKLEPLKKIILCGGDSYLSGLLEAIVKKSGMKVEYGDPLMFFKQGSVDHSALDDRTSRRYATALGLCLREP